MYCMLILQSDPVTTICSIKLFVFVCMCVCLHLQQQNQRMCVVIGRHIKETVHQQNTDEIPHWLLLRLTPGRVLTSTR